MDKVFEDDGLADNDHIADLWKQGHDLKAEIPDDVPSGPPVKVTAWDDLDELVQKRIVAALGFFDRGRRIVPVRAGDKVQISLDGNGKIRDFNSQNELREVMSTPVGPDLYINYGVRGGAIDCDNGLKRGRQRQGEAAFEQVIADNGGDFPETLKVRTPSSGCHYIVEPSKPYGDANTLPRDIDVKCIGYVVGPYSELITGHCDEDATPGVYEIEEGSIEEIAPAPSWLEEYFRAASVKQADLDPLVKWDLPESIDAFEDFLIEYEPAVEGDYGDTHTYTLFCYACDYGVSMEKAIAMVLKPRDELDGESWNSACTPPWDVTGQKSLRTKALSGYKSRQNSPGVKSPYFKRNQINQINGAGPEPGTTPGDDRDLVQTPAAETMPGDTVAEEKTPAVTIVERSFGEILDVEPKPVVDLWGGFLERGIVNFMSGGGFAGKSGLMIQVGNGCAAGLSDVLGQVAEHCLFKFFSAEDDKDEIDRRVHRIVKGMELTREQLDMSRERATTINRFGRTDNALAVVYEDGEPELQPFYHELGEWIDKQDEHVLIVLDSAYNFARFPGKAKISEEAVHSYIRNVLGSIVGEQATLWLPWHPSAAGLERGDGGGWSVAWDNSPRLRSVMTKEKDKKTKEPTGRVILTARRNHGPEPEPLVLVRNRAGVFELGGAIEVKGAAPKNAVELLEMNHRHKEALAWLVHEVDKISREPDGPGELGLKDNEGLELRRKPVARAIEAGLAFTHRRLSQRWVSYADEAEMATSYNFDQIYRLLGKHFFEKGTTGGHRPRVKERWRVAGMDRWYMRVSAKGMFYFGDE